MNIVVVEPGLRPRTVSCDGSLSAMQSLVGGYTQAIYPFAEEVALICNEEGKVNGLPCNRALVDEEGAIYDIVCGTFFLCAAPSDSESFESLSPAQAAHYVALFHDPEVFFRVDGQLVCLKQPSPLEASDSL